MKTIAAVFMLAIFQPASLFAAEAAPRPAADADRGLIAQTPAATPDTPLKATNPTFDSFAQHSK
jgi:hypothetical protein